MSAAPKHTPGPWDTLSGPNEYIRVVGTDHGTVARLFRDDTPDWRENEANAALVAAAPDLLAACRLVDDADLVYEDGAPNGSYKIDAETMIALRAAIAKAEGK